LLQVAGDPQLEAGVAAPLPNGQATLFDDAMNSA
jgi:hypothetical protein